MLRILFTISDDIEPDVIRQMTAMAEALRSAGHEVRIEMLGPVPFPALQYAGRLCAWRPDVVHAWDERSAVWSASARWRVPRATLVWTSMNVPSARLARSAWWQRGLSRAINRRICPAPALVELLHSGGWPAERLAVVGPVLPRAAQAPFDRGGLLAQLGLPANVRLIGAVARALPSRRFKELIWTGDLLKVIRDDTHVLLWCAGPQRGRLERYRRQVRIEDRVHFVDDIEYQRALPALDVFWQALEDATLAPAMIEAAAAGVPIVAADVPATREFIAAGGCGMLVPLGDRAGRTKRTVRILDDADLAQRLSAAGRQFAAARYDGDAALVAHVDVYRTGR